MSPVSQATAIQGVYGWRLADPIGWRWRRRASRRDRPSGSSTGLGEDLLAHCLGGDDDQDTQATAEARRSNEARDRAIARRVVGPSARCHRMEPSDCILGISERGLDVAFRALADGASFAEAYGDGSPRSWHFTAGGAALDHFAASLAEFDALAIDLPGFGPTPAPSEVHPPRDMRDWLPPFWTHSRRHRWWSAIPSGAASPSVWLLPTRIRVASVVISGSPFCSASGRQRNPQPATGCSDC